MRSWSGRRCTPPSGEDRIAVWVCDVPADTTNSLLRLPGSRRRRRRTGGRVGADHGRALLRRGVAWAVHGHVHRTRSHPAVEHRRTRGLLGQGGGADRRPVHQRPGHRHPFVRWRPGGAGPDLVQPGVRRERARCRRPERDPARRVGRRWVDRSRPEPVGRRPRDRSHVALAALVPQPRRRVRQPGRRHERRTRRRMVHEANAGRRLHVVAV